MPEQPEQGRPRVCSLGAHPSPCIVKLELPAHQQNVDADAQEQNSNGTEDFMKLRRLLDPRVPLLEEGQLYHGKGHNSFLPLHIYLCIYIFFICPVLQVRILYIPRKMRNPPPLVEEPEEDDAEGESEDEEPPPLV